MSCLTWPCFWYTRSQSFHWYKSSPNQLSNYMRETRDVDIGKHWHLAQTMRMMSHFMMTMIQDYFLDHFWISYASMMILCGRCIAVGRGISSLGKWIWQYQDFCCLRIDWQALEASSRDYPCWINAIVTQLCKPNNLCGRYRYGALHDGFGSGGGVDAWTCSIPGHFQNHDWIAIGIWRLENIQSMATSCFSNTLSSKKKGGIENCL